MFPKLSVDSLGNISVYVNIDKINNCCINNNLDILEINDLLENIVLLLKYITKKPYKARILLISSQIYTCILYTYRVIYKYACGRKPRSAKESPKPKAGITKQPP